MCVCVCLEEGKAGLDGCVCARVCVGGEVDDIIMVTYIHTQFQKL